MNGHRLPSTKGKTTAYICGDTTYPGQGIPGAALSGIIAAEKIIADWK
jgi:phytoene dehydrogenase-like protein